MSSILPNIPPPYTGLAHALALLLYLSLLPRRLRGWRFWCLAAALLAAQTGYMTATGYLIGWRFNLSMAGAALLSLLPLWLLCKISWQKAVYLCARAFILGGFAASLAWQLYLFFMPRFPVLGAAASECVFILLCYAAVLGCFSLLERRQRADLTEMTVSTLSCGSAGLVATVIYIVSSLSFAPFATPFGGSTYAEAFNIRTMVYLGGVAILYAFHLQLCESYARQEVDALQNILNVQYANYCANLESVDLINRKYHDLKHQIAILRTELGSGEQQRYLGQMEKEIRAYEAQNKTGNKVLDTILTGKSLHCQTLDIRMTCVADGAALAFMDVMDLSTLFGNALDNAIESVSKLADPEQRLIHLSVARQKGFLRIRVENCCDPSYRVRDALPGTTKGDKRYHGYGLKSIRATAEKYGGSATVQADNGWFELRVLIPVAEDGSPVKTAGG